MDLLGVGPLELIFVLLIIFLVLGPDDLEATGRKIGRFLSTMRKSEFWRGVNDVSKEIRSLPTTLMREAELEDAKKEIEKDFEQVKNVPQEFKMSEFKIPTRDLESLEEPAKNSEPEAESEPEPEGQPDTPEPSPADGEETSDS
ncbi:MAG: hypothetical protein GWN14_10170 [candidate division Zixibacteria bacterium]|nr:hypothetical protein [Gammaproteobacteria bacterium]NIX56270.1 hypothetical protein [candidate division Zixibacteria bacterium]